MNKNLVIVLIVILILIIIAVIYFMLPKNNNMTPTNQESTASLSQNSQSSSSSNSSSSSFNIQGMTVNILQQGTGAVAKTGDTVTVNYTGTLQDGTKFDSSLNPGRTPFSFTLGNSGPGGVIEGWNLGVEGMKVGEKRQLTIPPELGYGAQSPSPLIPANSTLIFEIDLLSINK